MVIQNVYCLCIIGSQVNNHFTTLTWHSTYRQLSTGPALGSALGDKCNRLNWHLLFTFNLQVFEGRSDVRILIEMALGDGTWRKRVLGLLNMFHLKLKLNRLSLVVIKINKAKLPQKSGWKSNRMDLILLEIECGGDKFVAVDCWIYRVSPSVNWWLSVGLTVQHQIFRFSHHHHPDNQCKLRYCQTTNF